MILIIIMIFIKNLKKEIIKNIIDRIEMILN